eukprot:scaffold25307_cov109-Isochrysis_galbana.AAC.3
MRSVRPASAKVDWNTSTSPIVDSPDRAANVSAALADGAMGSVHSFWKHSSTPPSILPSEAWVRALEATTTSDNAGDDIAAREANNIGSVQEEERQVTPVERGVDGGERDLNHDRFGRVVVGGGVHRDVDGADCRQRLQELLQCRLAVLHQEAPVQTGIAVESDRLYGTDCVRAAEHVARDGGLGRGHLERNLGECEAGVQPAALSEAANFIRGRQEVIVRLARAGE